jgi:hypothetical protein
VSLFPTHLVAVTVIGDFLRRMDVFSTAQLIIMQHSAREYPGLGECLLARIFFPSLNHFRILLRDFPAGVPITVTLPSGTKVIFQVSQIPPRVASLVCLPLLVLSNSAIFNCSELPGMSAVSTPFIYTQCPLQNLQGSGGVLGYCSNHRPIVCMSVSYLYKSSLHPHAFEKVQIMQVACNMHSTSSNDCLAFSNAAARMLCQLSCPLTLVMHSFRALTSCCLYLLLKEATTATNIPCLHDFFHLFSFSPLCALETASLCLRPPPGGYVEHGAGELVLSAHDSQRVLACERPEELLGSALATWYRENLVAESDCHGEDMAFTKKDQQGNLILGLHTLPAIVIVVTQTGLCIFPDGTNQPATSFMIVLRLWSVVNTASLHYRRQGRQRVDTSRATYELFPAVGGMLHQRATFLAPVQPSQPKPLPGPQIVEIVEPETEPFMDAGTTSACLWPFNVFTAQYASSQSCLPLPPGSPFSHSMLRLHAWSSAWTLPFFQSVDFSLLTPEDCTSFPPDGASNMLARRNQFYPNGHQYALYLSLFACNRRGGTNRWRQEQAMEI